MAKTVDKKPKDVKKLKKVKLAVETMETDDATNSRTSRMTQNCDGRILWIEFSKMVESGDWTSCGTRGDH